MNREQFIAQLARLLQDPAAGRTAGSHSLLSGIF